MRLHFQRQGDGHPLIILHGFLGSSDNWRAMSKRLAALYKVYCVDLRNHGQSPHSNVMNYPIMAEDLREFIEEHGLGPSFVLGHSMGGKVAIQFAAQYPGMVDKLIAVDIAPKAYPPTQKSLLAALRGLNLPAFKIFGDIDSVLSSAIPEQATRQFLMKNLTRDGDHGFRWRIPLDAIMNNYDELTRAVIVGQPFNKPVCFIRGGRSNFLEDSDLPSIRACFPQAQFNTIAGAGHWVHIDAPVEFSKIVVDFLNPPSS
jgi:esterase